MLKIQLTQLLFIPNQRTLIAAQPAAIGQLYVNQLALAIGVRILLRVVSLSQLLVSCVQHSLKCQSAISQTIKRQDVGIKILPSVYTKPWPSALHSQGRGHWTLPTVKTRCVTRAIKTLLLQLMALVVNNVFISNTLIHNIEAHLSKYSTIKGEFVFLS